MALFACSFDAVSPLSPWTTATGVSIVAGRNANGCSIPNASAFLSVTGSFGIICTGGTAYKPNQFTNQILKMADNGGGIGAPHAEINNNGDGRVTLTIGASSLGSTTTAPFDDFVQNIGIWRFFELSIEIVKIVTPVDATHSDLSIQVTATLYVNNALIGTVTDGWGISNILNSSLPLGIIDTFSIQQNFGTVDDCYVDTARIGDCFVASDDTTVTVETSAPDLTQSLFEVGLIDPTAAPDITQSLYEVGVGPVTPIMPLTLACPVGGGTATVGVAYSKTLVSTGGTAPVTYSLYSGTLPPGLSLNTSTGEISGTPTTVGSYSPTYAVEDSVGIIAFATCPINVTVAGGETPGGVGYVFEFEKGVGRLATYQE